MSGEWQAVHWPSRGEPFSSNCDDQRDLGGAGIGVELLEAGVHGAGEFELAGGGTGREVQSPSES